MPPASSEVSSNKPVTPERIMQFAWAYAIPLAIESAIQSRLFDVLDKAQKPLTISEIAEKTGASPRGLTAIANVLASFQLLTKDVAKQTYTLSPESAAFLVSTKPSFQGGVFKHISSQLLPKWLQLPQIVRDGRPAIAVNEQKPGSEFFENFVEDIFPMSYPATQALAGHLKLGEKATPTKVLDIASGSGVWGIGLAKVGPKVTVAAVDWENVLQVARRVATKHGVADRFSYIAGDIGTVDWGKDYDLATLGHILHSEGPERSKALLKRVGSSLKPGGTIAIAEFVADEGRAGPPGAMIFALNMIVNTNEGDTFTFDEITEWLKEAGFVDARKFDAPGTFAADSRDEEMTWE